MADYSTSPLADLLSEFLSEPPSDLVYRPSSHPPPSNPPPPADTQPSSPTPFPFAGVDNEYFRGQRPSAGAPNRRLRGPRLSHRSPMPKKVDSVIDLLKRLRITIDDVLVEVVEREDLQAISKRLKS